MLAVRSLLLPPERACERFRLTLRDRQREVVVNFVRGRDVFVSLPTVSGKSLSGYKCLPWTFDQLRGTGEQAQSIVVVVTILISLIKYRVGAALYSEELVSSQPISTPYTAASDYMTNIAGRRSIQIRTSNKEYNLQSQWSFDYPT